MRGPDAARAKTRRMRSHEPDKLKQTCSWCTGSKRTFPVRSPQSGDKFGDPDCRLPTLGCEIALQSARSRSRRSRRLLTEPSRESAVGSTDGGSRPSPRAAPVTLQGGGDSVWACIAFLPPAYAAPRWMGSRDVCGVVWCGSRLRPRGLVSGWFTGVGGTLVWDIGCALWVMLMGREGGSSRDVWSMV